MTRIAVVHMDLNSKGGGEAVAMNVLEALQNDYDLTLITLAEPDIEALNGYFNTAVDVADLTIRHAGRLAPGINRMFGVQYYILQNALLARYARRHADDFDLLVSTINELGLPAGSIEYVHFPFDWTLNLETRGDIFHPSVEGNSLYERLCTMVAGVRESDLQTNTVFANSEWTAECFENAYGTRPEVLFPPIDTSEFTDQPWQEREHGFVTVGRIERSKRIKALIRIIDRVRERGHDVHLHVIGPTYDENYYREVELMATTRSHIELDGELPRSELVQRICSHRYGIHGKEHEHFGMAVAEIAAGSAIPFVPSTGGQQAIVRNDDRLLYDSIEDAAEKIDRVLSNPGLQSELRMDKREIERQFGTERFKTWIRAAVAESLDRPVRDSVPPEITIDPDSLTL